MSIHLHCSDQTATVGTNGYGKFDLSSAGVWTYTMNTAHNEFVAGTSYTDSITVTTADGTQQVVTVTIAGTNDAAVLTPAMTASQLQQQTAHNK